MTGLFAAAGEALWITSLLKFTCNCVWPTGRVTPLDGLLERTTGRITAVDVRVLVNVGGILLGVLLMVGVNVFVGVFVLRGLKVRVLVLVRVGVGEMVGV